MSISHRSNGLVTFSDKIENGKQTVTVKILLVTVTLQNLDPKFSFFNYSLASIISIGGSILVAMLVKVLLSFVFGIVFSVTSLLLIL